MKGIFSLVFFYDHLLVAPDTAFVFKSLYLWANQYYFLCLALLFWCLMLLSFRAIYIKFQKQSQLKITEQSAYLKSRLDPLQSLLNLLVEKRVSKENKSIGFHQVSDVLRKQLHEKLKLFEAKKAYQNPNILLDQLAREMGTNSRYLSLVIREQFDRNFTDYINELRVKEILNMFANGLHNKMTLEGLSQLAGFNSRVTFNRAFKKCTGKTPSVYLEEIETNKKAV